MKEQEKIAKIDMKGKKEKKKKLRMNMKQKINKHCIKKKK